MLKGECMTDTLEGFNSETYLVTVKGKPITPKQAKRVLQLTCRLEKRGRPLWIDDLPIDYPRLNLNYLYNYRVQSEYVITPFGWCDWDGGVGISNLCLKYYPSVERIYQDWVTIAKNFPFLDLECQLIEVKGLDMNWNDDFPALVNFSVREGAASWSLPKAPDDYLVSPYPFRRGEVIYLET